MLNQSSVEVFIVDIKVPLKFSESVCQFLILEPIDESRVLTLRHLELFDQDLYEGQRVVLDLRGGHLKQHYEEVA